MMKPAIVALCALPLSACALFSKPSQSSAAATIIIEQPAPTLVSLPAQKVAHGAKAQARAAAGPRAIIPCFNASPITNDCRWDRTLNENTVRQNLQADVSQNKAPPIQIRR